MVINVIRKITPAGVVTTIATNISSPHGVAVDKTTGNINTAGRTDNLVYKISTGGIVKRFAGNSGGGTADGVGLSSALCTAPMDLDTDMNGNLYIAEQLGTIRRIKLSDTTVTTLVGKTAKPNQFKDGRADTVLVNYCTGVAAKDTATLFLTSLIDNVVKKYNKPYVASTVGIEKTELTKITIYPNPTNGKMIIENISSPNVQIFVRDLLGNTLINKQESNQVKTEIDLTEHQNGIYFVEIISETNREIIKVIKN